MTIWPKFALEIPSVGNVPNRDLLKHLVLAERSKLKVNHTMRFTREFITFSPYGLHDSEDKGEPRSPKSLHGKRPDKTKQQCPIATSYDERW